MNTIGRNNVSMYSVDRKSMDMSDSIPSPCPYFRLSLCTTSFKGCHNINGITYTIKFPTVTMIRDLPVNSSLLDFGSFCFLRLNTKMIDILDMNITKQHNILRPDSENLTTMLAVDF